MFPTDDLIAVTKTRREIMRHEADKERALRAADVTEPAPGWVDDVIDWVGDHLVEAGQWVKDRHHAPVLQTHPTR